MTKEISNETQFELSDLPEEWEHHKGSYKEYHKMKSLKVANQLEFERNAIIHEEGDDFLSIFHNVIAYVNSFSFPPPDKLRKMIIQHGGRCETYDGNRVTHVICDNVPDTKVKHLLKKKESAKKWVHPDWVVKSIEMGKKLQEKLFKPNGLRGDDSNIGSFFGGSASSLTSSSASIYRGKSQDKNKYQNSKSISLTARNYKSINSLSSQKIDDSSLNRKVEFPIEDAKSSQPLPMPYWVHVQAKELFILVALQDHGYSVDLSSPLAIALIISRQQGHISNDNSLGEIENVKRIKSVLYNSCRDDAKHYSDNLNESNSYSSFEENSEEVITSIHEQNQISVSKENRMIEYCNDEAKELGVFEGMRLKEALAYGVVVLEITEQRQRHIVAEFRKMLASWKPSSLLIRLSNVSSLLDLGCQVQSLVMLNVTEGLVKLGIEMQDNVDREQLLDELHEHLLVSLVNHSSSCGDFKLSIGVAQSATQARQNNHEVPEKVASESMPTDSSFSSSSSSSLSRYIKQKSSPICDQMDGVLKRPFLKNHSAPTVKRIKFNDIPTICEKKLEDPLKEAYSTNSSDAGHVNRDKSLESQSKSDELANCSLLPSEVDPDVFASLPRDLQHTLQSETMHKVKTQPMITTPIVASSLSSESSSVIEILSPPCSKLVSAERTSVSSPGYFPSFSQINPQVLEELGPEISNQIRKDAQTIKDQRCINATNELRGQREWPNLDENDDDVVVVEMPSNHSRVNCWKKDDDCFTLTQHAKLNELMKEGVIDQSWSTREKRELLPQLDPAFDIKSFIQPKLASKVFVSSSPSASSSSSPITSSSSTSTTTAAASYGEDWEQVKTEILGWLEKSAHDRKAERVGATSPPCKGIDMDEEKRKQLIDFENIDTDIEESDDDDDEEELQCFCSEQVTILVEFACGLVDQGQLDIVTKVLKLVRRFILSSSSKSPNEGHLHGDSRTLFGEAVQAIQAKIRAVLGDQYALAGFEF